MRAYTKDDVQAYAAGHYNDIALNLCPELSRAIKTPGIHVPDPFKQSSKDGFRVLKDFNHSGRMVFNNNFGIGGKYIDFYQYLVVTGKTSDFYKSLELVGNLLNCPRNGKHLKGSTVVAETKAERIAREQRVRAIKRHNELMMQKQKEFEKQTLIRSRVHIQDLLSKCISLKHTDAQPAWEYLENRGLGALQNAPDCMFENILFAPDCPYYEGNRFVCNYHAIVCKIYNADGKLWSLHRTYIKDGAKAPIDSPKMIMKPQLNNGSPSRYIPIGEIPEHGIIGVAEGLETALSVHLAMHMTVYPTVNANTLCEFIPPKGVKGVIVFSDKDASGVGQAAASRLVARLKSTGIKAFIATPKEEIPESSKGVDWNDVFMQKGFYGFPEPLSMMQYVMNSQL